MTLAKRRALTAYVLLAIPLAFFILVRIVPTLSALQVAFYQWDMLSDNRPFVGLDNFQHLPSDAAFVAAMANTLKYLILGVPIGLALALTIALGLTRIRLVPYALASLVFMAPATAVYVYAGWAGGEALAGEGPLGETAWRVGIALTALACLAVLPRLVVRFTRSQRKLPG